MKPIRWQRLIMVAVLTIGMATILVVSPASGQSLTGYGVKTGTCIGRQDYQSLAFGGTGFLDHSLIGLDLGVFIKLSGPRLFYQGELHFVQKGSTDKQLRTDGVGNVIGTIRTSYRIDYISLPISAGIELRRKTPSIYIFAGPRLDISPGSTSEAFEGGWDDPELFVVGTDIGIGMQIPAGRSHALLLEVRYAHDWTDAFSSEFYTIHNRALQILLGIERRVD